jgi:hypothetical protein
MARSLAAVLASLWQESIKSVGPGNPGWAEYLDRQRETRAPQTDALLIVGRWLAHVPPEQVHIVTVPPAGSAPAVLLGRFSEALGLDTASGAVNCAASGRSVASQPIQARSHSRGVRRSMGLEGWPGTSLGYLSLGVLPPRL